MNCVFWNSLSQPYDSDKETNVEDDPNDRATIREILGFEVYYIMFLFLHFGVGPQSVVTLLIVLLVGYR